jgi:uncharacterized protein (DUF2461 family)
MNIVGDVPQFIGFPKDFVDFLFSLQFNNTIELLPENKLIYKRLISEPLMLLFNGLMQPALSVSETLVTKPSKCVSTMYSDMRFSRNTPLKGYMYIRFRESSSEKDILGLYFDMGCDYYSYGIRIYRQTGAGMEKIRDCVTANKQAFIRELTNMESWGMKIKGEKFAKDHFPKVENTTIKDLFNSRGFYVGRDGPISDIVFSGELQNVIYNAYIELKGLYLLLRKSLYGK